jgi:hypothetical protein
MAVCTPRRDTWPRELQHPMTDRASTPADTSQDFLGNISWRTAIVVDNVILNSCLFHPIHETTGSAKIPIGRARMFPSAQSRVQGKQRNS